MMETDSTPMETDSAVEKTLNQDGSSSNTELDALKEDNGSDCDEEVMQDASGEGSQGEEDNVEDDDDPGEDHEFEIIDQVESEEEEKETEGGDGAGSQEKQAEDDGKAKDDYGVSSDSSSEEDDVDDSELHAMLEKGINRDSIKKRPVPSEGKPVIKWKTVLKELESDPFDILPEGWVCVTHHCGMPTYLHRESRVCTLARPYYLGKASTRTHSIPVSAIPCLMYRKQLDKIAEAEKEAARTSDQLPVAERGPDGDARSGSVVAQASQDQSEPVVCPVSAGQRAVLVTEESSCQGTINQDACPKEVLHTGKDEFNMIDETTVIQENIAVEKHDGAATCKDSFVGDGNLAVASEATTEWAGSPSGIGPETFPTIGTNSIAAEESSISRVCENTDLVALPVCEKDGREESKVNTVGEEELEEGEILDESSSPERDEGKANSGPPNPQFSSVEVLPQQESDVSAACSLESDLPQQPAQAGIVQSSDDGVTIGKAEGTSDGHNDSQPSGNEENKLNGSHIVREEEASGSQEPSEIVTSGSNSLATIKRKIESLRNRRGAKHRRLDNGSGGASASAAAWPIENNVAVSSLQYGDASSATMNAKASEALRANAAAIKIKSAEERVKESLDSNAVQSYCSKLFQFKVIEVKKHSTWKERRKHIEQRNRRNRPELPSSTKLITCPIFGNNKVDPMGGGPHKREFILNPTGKSYLCILHEYMQRTLKIQPLYVFKELENSKTPYGATVTINSIEYGTGYASSKKVAKQEAAKETLKILMPDLFNKMTDQEIKGNLSDISFFNNVKVTDSRVNDLGNKVGQPSPFEILQKCLRRNFGMGNTQCQVSTKPLRNQKCEYSIKVKDCSASVVAKNKRDGKQLAAQAILAKLHPHVPTWGSMLRLYGNTEEKPIQKPEEINDVKSHAPNLSVLARLREEMTKLHRQKEAIQVKGKIIISSKDLPNKRVGVDL